MTLSNYWWRHGWLSRFNGRSRPSPPRLMNACSRTWFWFWRVLASVSWTYLALICQQLVLGSSSGGTAGTGTIPCSIRACRAFRGHSDTPTRPRSTTAAGRWNRWNLPEWFPDKLKLILIINSLLINKGRVYSTCDFSIEAVALSHIGLISNFESRSLSPCRKNSSIILWVHSWYRGRGLVGLLKSAQWTIFCRICRRSE